jgi:hypothetical protein
VLPVASSGKKSVFSYFLSYSLMYILCCVCNSEGNTVKKPKDTKRLSSTTLFQYIYRQGEFNFVVAMDKKRKAILRNSCVFKQDRILLLHFILFGKKKSRSLLAKLA